MPHDRRTALSFAVALLAIAALAAGVVWRLRAPGRREAPAGPAPAAMPTPSTDLADYCRDVDQHPILGRERSGRLEQTIALFAYSGRDPNEPPAPRDASQPFFDQGMASLVDADFEAVLPALDQALKLAVDGGAAEARRGDLLIGRAVANLRIAENDNCAAVQNPFLCLLRVGPEGAYRDKAGLDAAIADLEAALRLDGTSLTARWLLNVANMLRGTYPGQVPGQWLIPPERFASTRAAPRFVNVAQDLGLATVNLAGGSVIEDFDNDGKLDILATTYHPCEHALYFHNEGDGRLADRSIEAGLGEQFGGLNAMQTDYDNDGWLDLYIARGGWQFEFGRHRPSLLRNSGGVFTDVTLEAGLATQFYPSQTAAWADFDADGDLDVYVGNEASLAQRQGFPSQLYRNNGDGTFTDVAVAAGVANGTMTKGAAWGDYDNDGDPDLYVSTRSPANRLYRNNGDGTFTDVATEMGVTGPTNLSFATWFFDYDNDGWLDIFVASYPAPIAAVVRDYMGEPPTDPALRPRLYRNLGGGGFEDVTVAAGLNRALMPMGANYGDIDNDGWPDIYLATGAPAFQAIVPNVMFWNDQGRGFVDVTDAAAVGHLPKGHGTAFGDLDNDGDQDIYQQGGGFFAGDRQPNALFENPGAGNHWVTLRLVGVRSNRAAIGARIAVTITEGGAPRTVHALVGSGGSFGASSLQAEIGLGQATRIDAIAVAWPTSGTKQVFQGAPLDRFLEIREDGRDFTLLDRPPVALYHGPGPR